MLVLMSLKALSHDPDERFDTYLLAREIETAVMAADESIKACSARPDFIVLGRDDPDRLKSIAKHWNSDVHKALVDAVNALTPAALVAAEHGGDLDNTLRLGSQNAFMASLAARALSDRQQQLNSYGVYVENEKGWPCWRATLDAETLHDVMCRTVKYLAATVSVS